MARKALKIAPRPTRGWERTGSQLAQISPQNRINIPIIQGIQGNKSYEGEWRGEDNALMGFSDRSQFDQ